MNRTLTSLSVKDQDKDFIKANNDYEQYALVYSHNMALIFGEDCSKEDRDLGRFIQIVNTENSHIVYRKCVARYGIYHNEIALGYRTQQELGLIQNKNMVRVSNSSWFNYYWNNSDYSARWAFRITVIGFGLTVISSIVTILSFFIKLPISC